MDRVWLRIGHRLISSEMWNLVPCDTSWPRARTDNGGVDLFGLSRNKFRVKLAIHMYLMQARALHSARQRYAIPDYGLWHQLS